MVKFNLDKITLKKFALTMGIAFLAIAGLLLFRYNNVVLSVLSISFIFFLTGLILPNLLKPVYIIWMHFALILGLINTRIILVILFYLIFTPMSLIMRLFRIDLLERKRKEVTYWHRKDKVAFNPLNYEKRF